jgi:hypothetical protein
VVRGFASDGVFTPDESEATRALMVPMTVSDRAELLALLEEPDASSPSRG